MRSIIFFTRTIFEIPFCFLLMNTQLPRDLWNEIINKKYETFKLWKQKMDELNREYLNCRNVTQHSYIIFYIQNDHGSHRLRLNYRPLCKDDFNSLKDRSGWKAQAQREMNDEEIHDRDYLKPPHAICEYKWKAWRRKTSCSLLV